MGLDDDATEKDAGRSGFLMDGMVLAVCFSTSLSLVSVAILLMGVNFWRWADCCRGYFDKIFSTLYFLSPFNNEQCLAKLVKATLSSPH